MFTIPNLITSLNLFFGCCALVSLQQDNYPWALCWILLAVLADFADGFVARALKQTSAFGLQLDSLSDVVSFGVVPGFIAFHFLEVNYSEYPFVPYVSFLIALMAAFRLARYNLTGKGEAYFFEGLPVPANALFFTGLLGLEIQGRYLGINEVSGIAILLFIGFFSYLMISPFRILKIHVEKNWLSRYYSLLILLGAAMLSWIWIGPIALSLAVTLHIVYSITIQLTQSK